MLLTNTLSKGKPGAERAITAAKQARQAMGLKDGEPIRDIRGLLEANGIKVR